MGSGKNMRKKKAKIAEQDVRRLLEIAELLGTVVNPDDLESLAQNRCPPDPTAASRQANTAHQED